MSAGLGFSLDLVGSRLWLRTVRRSRTPLDKLDQSRVLLDDWQVHLHHMSHPLTVPPLIGQLFFNRCALFFLPKYPSLGFKLHFKQ